MPSLPLEDVFPRNPIPTPLPADCTFLSTETTAPLSRPWLESEAHYANDVPVVTRTAVPRRGTSKAWSLSRNTWSSYAV